MTISILRDEDRVIIIQGKSFNLSRSIFVVFTYSLCIKFVVRKKNIVTKKMLLRFPAKYLLYSIIIKCFFIDIFNCGISVATRAKQIKKMNFVVLCVVRTHRE